MNFKVFKLYCPFFFSVILITMLFFVNNTGEKQQVTVNFFNAFQYTLPLQSSLAVKAGLLVGALISLGIYFFIDYAALFPSHLKLQVFYDPEGIDKSLQIFSKKELKELRIKHDYQEHQQHYYNDLDAELKKIINAPCFFAVSDGHIYSKGETSFIVKKVDGIQRYMIEESKGQTDHTLERPNCLNYQFKTFFEKINSAHDHLKPTIADIFIRRCFILRPIFKQIIAENYRSDGILFHHSLYGVTKINFFPVPSISNTLYFYKNGDELIPIAYAIYEEG